MRAVLRVVGEEERRAHVAFISLAARILAKGIVEAAEVRQIRDIGNKTLHASIESRFLFRVAT